MTRPDSGLLVLATMAIFPPSSRSGEFDIAAAEAGVVSKQEVDLYVGDTLLVGDMRLIVVDIDGDDVTFRIDDSNGPDSSTDVVIRPR